MKGDTTPYFRQNLTGAYTTIDAGLAALARQIITRKAANDAAQILAMLDIQEES